MGPTLDLRIKTPNVRIAVLRIETKLKIVEHSPPIE